MGMNWTKEQAQVIESRGRNLLVSAAAGSGKTAVLVERIIRMITDKKNPVDIEHLLVMTFTKAAASEMRERIRSAIEKKLEENPSDAHLQQQAVMVQYAQITTIDSFCLHVIREHFDRLDIDPAFRVGDEGEMLLMKSDVMEELLERRYADGGLRFKKFVDTYSIGKADGGISDYIEQVYTFAQSNPWPEQWFQKCRQELENVTIEDFDRTEWMKFLLRDVRIQAEEWEKQLLLVKEMCMEEDGPAPYLPMICEDLEQIRALKTVDSYEAFSQAAGSITFSKLAAVRGKTSPVSPEKKEAAAECRKRIKKSVEKLKSEYLFESVEQVVLDLEDGRDSVLMLLELAEEYAADFKQKKTEKNLVDFNDLEHLALEILLEEREDKTRVPSAAADEISGQYEEILVDEYQDSNLVQETLIQSISRERFGHPNVFMVGDVKQSIYKFRLARPELFLEKYHTYSSEDGLYQKIELHQNFRSRDEVLFSINGVFERIMTSRLGDIEYTDETALHPGASFEPREGLDELDTELLLINTAGSVLEQLDDDISDYTSRELEGGMIAGRIRKMVDGGDGRPPLTVWDKEEGRYRPVRYGDIVILLRSVSGWVESFIDVLSGQGIPAFAESRTGYFNTPEVETMLNMLALIDNPIQDIPLAAILKSPFGGLSDRELAHLTALYKKTPDKGCDRGLYGAVKRFLEAEKSGNDGGIRPEEAEKSGADLRLKEKLGRVMELIENLRKEAVYLPIHELLYRIYDATGYYDYVSAMPAGDVRRANLDMLAEKAAAYEATSYRGVFHFIKYIEKLKKYNTDFGEAPVAGEQGNTVRIMSIHKSKGLEFPVVFVAGMGKLFNKQDTRGKILIDSEYGIGTDYLDSEKRLKGPTLKKNVLKRRMELEALGEELRVLYVAMTRAREKLILTASDKNLESKLEKWNSIFSKDVKVPYTVLTSAGSYLDWVLMSLAGTGGENRIHIKEVRAEELLGAETDRQMVKRASKEEMLHFDTERVYDAAERELLEKSFSFCYPHAADVTLNTKISVSELKKEGFAAGEEESAFLPTIPAFMEAEDRSEGGVSRGTAYHRVLELLPFGEIAGEKEAEEFLNGLVESKKLSREAGELVRAGELALFLDSDLGARMAKARKRGCLFREKQFVMGIPAREMGDWDSDELVLIQGIIDAYFEDEDGALVLVDYKTDRVKDAAALIKRYQTQLTYYEKALHQILKKPVKEKIIYSWHLGEIKI